MQTIGYNIEWSQELTVAASLEEYVKAWMAIHLLRQWEPLREHIGPDPGSHVFDMSVGYDLAGISTDKVAAFIDGLIDATPVIERLRGSDSGGIQQDARSRLPARGSPTRSPCRRSTDVRPRRSTRSPAT